MPYSPNCTSKIRCFEHFVEEEANYKEDTFRTMEEKSMEAAGTHLWSANCMQASAKSASVWVVPSLLLPQRL